MKEYYLYGAGKILRKYIDVIDWSQVSGIIDAKACKKTNMYRGRKIFSPKGFDFDNNKIYVISSSKYFMEIKAVLIQYYDIRESNIIGLVAWLNTKVPSVDFKTYVPDYCAIEEVFYYLGVLGVESVLSYKDCFAQYGVVSLKDNRLKRWYRSESCFVDCCINKESIENSWPYNEISVSLCEKKYDALVNMDGWEGMSDLEITLFFTNDNYKFILVFFSYTMMEQLERCRCIAVQYGNVKITRGYAWGYILIFERNSGDSSIGMYVVTHKKSNLPHVYMDKEFFMIFAGAIGKDSCGYLRDDVGENISYLNPWLNELTALYWIWKNSNESIIGLCHYRRFFLYNSNVENISTNILRSLEAQRYLKSYDLITLNLGYNCCEYGMYKMLVDGIQENTLNEGMRIVRRLLIERQPNYIKTFEIVMHGVRMFPCNMFITRKDILDQYCTWLFSFIIDAAKEVSTLGYEGNDRRVIGFIAERMLTVWLLKQHLKIKELPMYFLPDE